MHQRNLSASLYCLGLCTSIKGTHDLVGRNKGEDKGTGIPQVRVSYIIY